MQKKYANNLRLVLLGLLATLAMSVALISCGEGKVAKESGDDYFELEKDITGGKSRGLIEDCFPSKDPVADGVKILCDQLFESYCVKYGGCESSGSEGELLSSSSDDESPSSSSDDEFPSSSSNDELPSSSSSTPPGSSSSSVPPDACVPVEVLTCELPSKTGNVGQAIIPTAKCGSKPLAPPLEVSWEGETVPSKPGLYDFSAIADDCGGCYQKVSCGTINVGGYKELKCSIPEGTKGKVGQAITPVPVVICNRNTVATTTGFTWAPANLTPTTSGNVPVRVTAGSGDCAGEAAECGSVEVEATSSSSSLESSSSSVESSSSSSVTPSCSSVTQSSSSSVPLSSSSSTPVFACNMTATTGTVGLAISPAPTATCNGTNVPAANLTWTPANYTPTSAGSVAVSVRAGSGVCNGMTASCGNITVAAAPTLTCEMTATEGTRGVAISPAPIAKCNGTAITSGITWTPANYTPTTTGNVTVSVSASSGTCAGKAATCGTVTVTAPPGECVGKTNISTYCPNVTWENVKWSNFSGTVACAFVTAISKFNGESGKLINGADFSSKNCGQTGWSPDDSKPCADILTTVDGGYYLYNYNSSNNNNSVTSGTAPVCGN